MRFYFSLMLFGLLLGVAENTLAGHSRSDFDQPPQIELHTLVFEYVCVVDDIPQDVAEKPTIVLETLAVSQTRQNYTRLIYFSNGKKNKDYLMVKKPTL